MNGLHQGIEVEVVAGTDVHPARMALLPGAADFHQRPHRLPWLAAHGIESRLVVVSRRGRPCLAAIFERAADRFVMWKGPAGEVNRTALAALARSAAALGRCTLVLLPAWDQPDLLRTAGFAPVPPFTTLRARTSTVRTEVLARMKPSTRSRVSRATRAGFGFRCDPAALPQFYELYAAAMRHAGSPDFASEDELAGLLRMPDVHLFVADLAGEVVAGSVCLQHDDALEARYVATSRPYRAQAPLNLVHAETMVWAARHGLEWFDLSGLATGELDDKLAAINRFKLGFGGERVAYPTFANDAAPSGSGGGR